MEKLHKQVLGTFTKYFIIVGTHLLYLEISINNTFLEQRESTPLGVDKGISVSLGADEAFLHPLGPDSPYVVSLANPALWGMDKVLFLSLMCMRG